MKESKNRKSTWALCLSIAAILLCLLVFALWAFEAIPHSEIISETFIGACVALLGVIVTVAVGSQIVNVMEVKSAQRKYEEELKVALEKIQRQQEQMEDEHRRNMYLHNCALAITMAQGKDYTKACYYHMSALYQVLQTKDDLWNVTFIFDHWRECLRQSEGVKMIASSEMKAELKALEGLLVQLPTYALIKDRYEPLRDEYFRRIGM